MKVADFRNSIGYSVHQCSFSMLVVSSLVSTFDIRSCNLPLGLESGEIPDYSVTASSSYVPNVGPQFGRLRKERAGGGWCPKQQIERDVREYLQVNLNDVHVISGVQTQGRFDHGRGQEYAEEYSIEYWRPGLDDWKLYSRWDGKSILNGNSDTATVVTHKMMPPITASQFRIIPYSVHRRTVCLRLELRGCKRQDGIVSYDMPEDLSWEPGQDLTDVSYDGKHSHGKMFGGVGRLTDGTYGGDNFKLDIGYGKGNGWVGWRKESFQQNYIELTFAFDAIRNFSSVHIYTNNCFSKQVQVFSKARIKFSMDGSYFQGRTVVYTYMPDLILENARNVSINLHNHLARFVQIQFYFAAQFIMISEVTFDSEPLLSNTTEDLIVINNNEDIVIYSGSEAEPPWDYETIAATKGEHEDEYVEVIIGVLTAIMLLLMGVFIVILVLSHRQKLQGSPTTILRNRFGVRINMKDLLMSLSPLSNGVVHVSSQPTPSSQELSSDPSSTFIEQQEPLVKSFSVGPNYDALKENDDQNPNDESAPLEEFKHNNFNPAPTSEDVSSYLSLQLSRSVRKSPSSSPKSRDFNERSGYYSEKESRKRYHTSPRDKIRVAPPIVTWNITPSMCHRYKCREVDLLHIPRYSLHTVETLGSCHLGDVNVCEMETSDKELQTVVVRTMTANCLQELRFLSCLSNKNLVNTLGVCTVESPTLVIMEYTMEFGDLVEFLNTNERFEYNSLIFMISQIASAMKYLECLNVMHKDLAARNCFVNRGHFIKVGDLAMANSNYKECYSAIGGRSPAPIRWLPWESILMERYTCSSSVWAFAVTVWEILSLARDWPFPHLTNQEVVQNAEHMYYGGELQISLPRPSLCASDVYELLCECWKRDPSLRPTFREIYKFFKHKTQTHVLELERL